MPQPTQTTPADAASAYFKNPLRLSMASSRTKRHAKPTTKRLARARSLPAAPRDELARPSANGDRRHRRAGAALDLQRLHDESEFKGARRRGRHGQSVKAHVAPSPIEIVAGILQ